MAPAFGNNSQSASSSAAAATTTTTTTAAPITTQNPNNSTFLFGNAAANTSLFSFTPQAPPAPSQSTNDEENDVPPEPNVEKYEEPDAKYSFRAKVYEKFKGDDGVNVKLLGVGHLYVKCLETKKLQIICRQEPDFRKVFMNEVITPSVPVKMLPKAVQFALSTLSGESRICIAKLATEKDSSMLYDLFTFERCEAPIG